MMSLWGFDLLRPLWLLAVPALALMAVLFARRSRSLGGWDQAVDPSLMAALDRLGKVSHGAKQTRWLAPLLAGLVAVALTGPAKERVDGVAFRNLDGVVIAVDLSPSMVEGGRFTDAQTTARLIAQSVGSRQVALVVYGGDAYRGSAFTTDGAALGQTIAFLDTETVPDGGSRPERALALAKQMIDEAEIVLGDVVLVTDGGGLSPLARAQAQGLKESGIPLSTIFVPSTIEGAPKGDRAGVDALAVVGGGASGDLLDPFPVTRALEQGLRRRLREMDSAVQTQRDYGRYLLLLAILPALALFRRRA